MCCNVHTNVDRLNSLYNTIQYAGLILIHIFLYGFKHLKLLSFIGCVNFAWQLAKTYIHHGVNNA